MEEKYLGILPSHLQQQGIRLHEYGYHQYAWGYPTIKEVVSVCRDNGFALIGCEFFLPPNERRKEPEATIDTWYTSRSQGEDWEQFVHRSASELIAYIDTEMVPSRGLSFWSSPDVVDEEHYNLLSELARDFRPDIYPLLSLRSLAARVMYRLVYLLRSLAAYGIVTRIVTHHFAFSSEQQAQTASAYLHRRGYSVMSFVDNAQRWQLHASRDYLPIAWLEEREKRGVLRMVERWGGEYLGSEFTEIHSPTSRG